jgi:hypothetical protein
MTVQVTGAPNQKCSIDRAAVRNTGIKECFPKEKCGLQYVPKIQMPTKKPINRVGAVVVIFIWLRFIAMTIALVVRASSAK